MSPTDHARLWEVLAYYCLGLLVVMAIIACSQYTVVVVFTAALLMATAFAGFARFIAFMWEDYP